MAPGRHRRSDTGRLPLDARWQRGTLQRAPFMSQPRPRAGEGKAALACRSPALQTGHEYGWARTASFRGALDGLPDSEGGGVVNNVMGI